MNRTGCSYSISLRGKTWPKLAASLLSDLQLVSDGQLGNTDKPIPEHRHVKRHLEQTCKKKQLHLGNTEDKAGNK